MFADIHLYLGIGGGILSFLAYVFYFRAIIKGETKPSRATWFIWTVFSFVIGSSYFFSGATTTIWVPVSELIGPLIVALLAIKYGEGGWTRFDKFVLLGAALCMVAWALTESAVVALVLSLAIDGIAVLPTIKKTYHHPETEDKFAWFLTFSGNVLNIFAIDRWIFHIALYPFFTAMIDGTVFTLLFRKGGNDGKK